MARRIDTLVAHLSEYGAYHATPGNRVVHLVFVPLLLWSAFVALAVIKPVASFLLWTAYAALYVCLEPASGIAAAGVYLAVLLHAQSYSQSAENPLSCSVAVHVASWWAQIVVGHGIFEKRKPALLDSLLPSLALAPLFVLLEVAFAFGYRRDLAERVHASVTLKRRQWQTKHQAVDPRR
jgi:2-hydroxy fatty acid dioxygenase